MPSTEKRNRWTVEPGRHLCFDGVEIVYLQRVDLGDRRYAIGPAATDSLAHRIAALLNLAEVIP